MFQIKNIGFNCFVPHARERVDSNIGTRGQDVKAFQTKLKGVKMSQYMPHYMRKNTAQIDKIDIVCTVPRFWK